jgi:UDP-2-acetamido-2-deoxy-ribo-hexuluronate aminotransferase
MSIPFTDLKSQYQSLKSDIHSRIDAVLEHGQYIMGPEVKELEERLEEFTGAKFCITVSSGTEALLIALMALEVGQGDEVITTPFTFVATAEVIALLGATPVYVDIEPDTCNIDARKIEAAITPRTKAIIPVSLYGQVPDMDAINTVARCNGNIPVIEDAAQSFGATYKGKKSCNLATIGCTSFFPSKPLGCYGDGGALFTNDEALAKACREIRVHGQSRRYFHTRIGVGGRMDTLQCAIVLAKLKSFEWEIEKRIEIGRLYRAKIQALGLSDIQLLGVRGDRTCVWGQFTIFAADREVLQTKLNEKGIPTAIHYPVPLNMQPAYRVGEPEHDTPNACHAAKTVMSLPMHSHLTEQTIDEICHALGTA